MNESTVELALLERLADLGWTVVGGHTLTPEAAPDERAGYDAVVLAGRLRAALARLNPGVPASALEDAFRKLTILPSPALVENNRHLHRLLADGVDVEFRRPDGSTAGAKVWAIAWDDPEANEFLAVNQFVVREGGQGNGRRTDVLLFVNGLPLVLAELKNLTDEGATVRNAFNQLQTYKAELPTLLAYNGFCVASDGREARAGTITADFERFQPWRDKDAGDARAAWELEPLVKGMLAPARLLDLVRSFTVYEDDSEKVLKKIAAYHQVAAVDKAVEETVRACGAGGDRKAGVVWHTQGSGKSLSMVFYAGKLVRRPEMSNPTLVVLTDRNDLDDQLYITFNACRDLLRQTPVQADSRAELKDLLRTGSGGVVFTTIQKFLPEDVGGKLDALTDRANVVVIADEAHRTQYGLAARVKRKGDEALITYGLAKHVRDALPNATFIAFTGTPVSGDDRNTRRVFGDYIDVYDIKRAVEDGATVPIYYEARLARLQLSEDQRPKLDPEFEEITEAEEADAREKLKTKWAAIEKLVGSPVRLKEVARDLVEHFDRRTEAMPGKAMVVCMSRRICVDLYAEIARLRPEWHSDDPAGGQMKVVMTGSADDPEAYRPHVRNKAAARALARRFKDAKDGLRVVIVRDMWLTGFDAPCVHTMYVDKPMHGHNLMQAIARVNRVFKDKPGGLVVDYLGLADQLKSAMRDYTEGGGRGDAVEQEQKSIEQLKLKYEQCRDLFHGFEWRETWLRGTPAQRLSLLPAAQEFVLAKPDGKKRFLDCTAALGKAFALASGTEEAATLREEVAFFQAVRAAMTKTTVEGHRYAESLDSAINQLISKAVISGGVIDIFSAAGLKSPDIAILSDEFLAEVRAMPHRNLALELLRKLINGEVKARQKKNVVQARRFSELLEKAVRQYQNRAVQAAQVIEELIALAKEMRQADARGQWLGLDTTEVAFYDALADNESAMQVLGDDGLKVIAVELVRTVKANTSIDWTVKESVQANLRRLVKRILRRYGYPPDLTDQATQTVLEQAKLLCAEVAGTV